MIRKIYERARNISIYVNVSARGKYVFAPFCREGEKGNGEEIDRDDLTR